MTEAYQQFQDRLKQLWVVTERLTRPLEDETMAADLEPFSRFVEDADKHLNRARFGQAAGGKLREPEVTRLLMANRVPTQSKRMLLKSMQALVGSTNQSTDPAVAPPSP